MSFQQRLVLAISLCISIMLVFDMMAPQPEVPVDGEPTTAEAAPDAETGESPAPEVAPPHEAVVEDVAPTQAAPMPAVEVVHHQVENDVLRLTLTNETPHVGGLISGVHLLADKFTGHEMAEGALALGDARTLEMSFADEATDFRLPKDASFEVRDAGSTYLSLGYRGGGVEILERFELLDGYQARLTVAVTNRSGREQVHRLHARVRMGEPEEQDRWDIHRGLCNRGEDLEDEDISDVEEGPVGYDGPVQWGGVDSKYFATLLVPQGPFSHCEVSSDERGEARYLVGSLASQPTTLAPGATAQHVFGVFLGVKELEALQGFDAVSAPGVDLSQAIDWGWFGSLSEYLGRLLLSLMRWFYELTGVWGVAILLLTVVVKLVTLPLTLKQMSSMKRMKEIQPEIQKLKEKYGSDKVKQGQEMQALFARSGVNPLAGCLPMFVQFPIWIALYAMLSTAVDLVHEPFLWLPDLTKQDPYYITPLGLGALMVLQQRLMPQTTMDPAQQKVMQWAMPIMFTFFMLFLPSGLGIYIFANILLSVIQTMIQVGSSKKAEAAAS